MNPTAPQEGKVEINDNLVDMLTILREQIKALRKSPKKGRERSFALMKLEEAASWVVDAMAAGDGD